jgi:hypothetical protein
MFENKDDPFKIVHLSFTLSYIHNRDDEKDIDVCRKHSKYIENLLRLIVESQKKINLFGLHFMFIQL